ncbi:MAG: hypothetical protein ACYCW6_02600 [Candidatus Xenobia bacterium]
MGSVESTGTVTPYLSSQVAVPLIMVATVASLNQPLQLRKSEHFFFQSGVSSVAQELDRKTDLMTGWLVAQQVEDLGQKLHRNWIREYGKPNHTALANAVGVLNELQGSSLQPTKVIPSAEEGVVIVFSSTNRYADIECLNTGEILAVACERENPQPDSWHVGRDGIATTIRRIAEYFGHGRPL